MKLDVKRRVLLKGSFVAGTLGVAVATGLLTPRTALAAWPRQAFTEKQTAAVLQSLFGTEGAEESNQIKFEKPADIAEDGSKVRVRISTTLPAPESISILAPKNPVTLVANFKLSKRSTGFAETNIKMGATGPLVAIVKSGGKLYMTSKEVQVTAGGCGS